MKCYKLTDRNGQTRNNTQWGPNVTHKASGTRNDLCSNGWIHFYTDPNIAVLLNPSHADIKNPILWEAETIGEAKHDLLKSGSKGLITLQQIALPAYTNVQKAYFAILCAKFVYKDIQWNEWANSYLTGVDRSKAAYAVNAAANAAANAVNAAANAAVNAAANAANAAAYAANAAAYTAADAAYAAAYAAANAAAAAYTVNAVNAAAYAAHAAFAAANAAYTVNAVNAAAYAAHAAFAAANAAYAAAYAANAAAAAYTAAAAEINFPELAKQALTYH